MSIHTRNASRAAALIWICTAACGQTSGRTDSLVDGAIDRDASAPSIVDARTERDAHRAMDATIAIDAVVSVDVRSPIDVRGDQAVNRDSAVAAVDATDSAQDALPPGAVIDIAVGQHHSCAVVASGSVYCWGRNNLGQLGDGTSVDRFAPTQVAVIRDATDVEAGANFTCVRRRVGGIFCWGQNTNSQLGRPATPYEATVVARVPNISDARAFSLGERHGCAVLAAPNSGEVRCWGNLVSDSARTVPGVTGAIAIASTATRTFALLADGRVVEWATASTLAGVVNVSEVGVAGVSADDNGACFSMLDGSVRCNGSDLYGRRGDGPTVNPLSMSSAALSITTATGRIASGGASVCAQATAGWSCWGRLIGNGRIPLDGNLVPSAFPSAGMFQFAFASHAGGHACAHDGSAVVCFGDDSYGQLGRGDSTLSKVPRALTDFGAGYSQLFLGAEGFCAKQLDGTVRCTGSDAVGIDVTEIMLAPTDTGRAAVADTALSAGGGVSLNTAGGVLEWRGRSAGGFSAPVPVPGLGLMSSIDRDGAKSCATEGGAAQDLFCWEGLGPSRMGVDMVSRVALGTEHGCVIRLNEVMCAGRNDSGQLGTTGATRATFAAVVDVVGPTDLTTDGSASCAVHSSGLVSCWGFLKTHANAWTSFHTPTQVTGFGGSAVQVERAHDTTCVINNLSELWCWGEVPGDGSQFSASPVRVASSATSMVGGARAFCYLPDATSPPRCWGFLSPEVFGRIESSRYVPARTITM